ncbi:unnamed protein product [Ambrosiozyma monospora]|uniref:Unnamed protein product n=1 Tax=Ambrosiozyma monospora TaxID=43982 RepID=A0ACB5ST35_AMBMO|nr:unnamed protein product [Ambrosiozyma monospora]
MRLSISLLTILATSTIAAPIPSEADEPSKRELSGSGILEAIGGQSNAIKLTNEAFSEVGNKFGVPVDVVAAATSYLDGLIAGSSTAAATATAADSETTVASGANATVSGLLKRDTSGSGILEAIGGRSNAIKLTNEAFSEVGNKFGVPSDVVAAATSYLDGLIAGSPTATATAADSETTVASGAKATASGLLKRDTSGSGILEAIGGRSNAIKLTNEAFSEVGNKFGVPSDVVAAATSYLDGLIAGSPTATATAADSETTVASGAKATASGLLKRDTSGSGILEAIGGRSNAIKLTNEAFSEVGNKFGVPSDVVAAATSYLDGLIAGSPTATATAADSETTVASGAKATASGLLKRDTSGSGILEAIGGRMMLWLLLHPTLMD